MKLMFNGQRVSMWNLAVLTVPLFSFSFAIIAHNEIGLFVLSH